jgi:DNA-binding PadR family transcriptional regulator
MASRLVNVGYYDEAVSTTRLMILGLVRWMQPVHGYDVRRELLSWRAGEWANIAPGSIYHALRRLSQEQIVEEVGTEQVGVRPARTTYRVTAKGELEFEELLRQYLWSYEAPVDPFLASFALLPAVPRTEAAAALRNRARLLRAGVDQHRFALASEWLHQTKPAHVGWMLELLVTRMEAEIAWCEQIATRIEGGARLLTDGVPVFPGQPPVFDEQ